MKQDTRVNAANALMISALEADFNCSVRLVDLLRVVMPGETPEADQFEEFTHLYVEAEIGGRMVEIASPLSRAAGPFSNRALALALPQARAELRRRGRG